MQQEGPDLRVGHHRGDASSRPVGCDPWASRRVWRDAGARRGRHARADARAQPLGRHAHARARGHRGHTAAEPLGRCHAHAWTGALILPGITVESISRPCKMALLFERCCHLTFCMPQQSDAYVRLADWMTMLLCTGGRRCNARVGAWGNASGGSHAGKQAGQVAVG